MRHARPGSGAKAATGQEERSAATRGFRCSCRTRGEVWSARALDEDQVIPVGASVDVMEIEGATAIVYPRELLP